MMNKKDKQSALKDEALTIKTIDPEKPRSFDEKSKSSCCKCKVCKCKGNVEITDAN